MARKNASKTTVAPVAPVAAAPAAPARKELKAYNYTGMVSDVVAREGSNGSFTTAKLTLDNGRTKRLKANAKQAEALSALDLSQPVAVWGVYTGGNEISVRRFSVPATDEQIAEMRAAKAAKLEAASETASA